MDRETLLLKEELELYRKSFCDSTDTIIITDLQGRIVVANKAWLDLYGYELDEINGKTTNIIRSDKNKDDLYRDIWAQINDPGKGYWNGEIINRKKNGKEIPVYLTITPIKR